MLAELKFCKGAIHSKDFIPALTHFIIKDRRVTAFNGSLALSSPIPFDIDCQPKAIELIKAIENCKETVQLGLTAAGRLSIKSAKYKTFINCIKEDTPLVQPEGEIVNFDGVSFLAGIKAVAPFIGTDASRLWSHGVLVKDQSLFATNNVLLVQYWIGTDFLHEFNVPGTAIKEMIRINEPPIHAQVAENSITFHYTEGRWLRTQLYTTEWPDLMRILNVESTQTAVPEELFEGLETIKSFVEKDGAVFLGGGKITTHEQENEGASYEIAELTEEGKFHSDMLMLLKGTAKTIDFSAWPKPCLFQGGKLRGAIVGIRK